MVAGVFSRGPTIGSLTGSRQLPAEASKHVDAARVSGRRRAIWLFVVLAALIGVCGGCGQSTGAIAEVERLHPEIADLQIDGAERVDRSVSSGGVVIGGNLQAAIYQRFVPNEPGVTTDDIEHAVIVAAENAGWTFAPSPYTGKLCGAAAALPDGSVPTLEVIQVPADSSGTTSDTDEASVLVTIVLSRSSCAEV